MAIFSPFNKKQQQYFNLFWKRGAGDHLNTWTCTCVCSLDERINETTPTVDVSLCQWFMSRFSSSAQVICKKQMLRRGSWVCCLRLYTTTWLAVSVRSQGGEARGSDWCSVVVPASPTDAGGDAGPEPAATVKSLIESFDTVGQSEFWAPQPHPQTPPNTPHQPRQQRGCWGQLLPVEISAVSLLSWVHPSLYLLAYLLNIGTSVTQASGFNGFCLFFSSLFYGFVSLYVRFLQLYSVLWALLLVYSQHLNPFNVAFVAPSV